MISTTKHFIFIASLKTASTAIEAVLQQYADISLVTSENEKHMYLVDIEKRFGTMFMDAERQQFLIFGVMRNPVDYMLSLYNSHTEHKFRDIPRLYTGNMDFDRFLVEWSATNEDQIVPQFIRFLNSSGQIGADYIISYDNLTSGLNYVSLVIDVPDLVNLPAENVSIKRIQRGDLSAKQLD